MDISMIGIDNILIKRKRYAEVLDSLKDNSVVEYEIMKVRVDDLERKFITDPAYTRIQYANDRQQCLDDYEERNNYYRTLLGLPPKEDTVLDYIYVPNEYSGADEDKPIHELTENEFLRAKNAGYIAKVKSEHPDKKYVSYIPLKLDIISIREADYYDILYWNTDNIFNMNFITEYSMIRTRFLKTNRNMLQETFHTDYEAVMISYLLLNTLLVLELKSPKDRLDLDTYSTKEIYELLAHYGFNSTVESPQFFITLVNRLNTILRYKGTNSLFEIIDEFHDGDYEIDKYVLVKKLNEDYVAGVDDDENGNPISDRLYNLFFVRTPVKESAHKYINDPDRLVSFDDMVRYDPLWDKSGDQSDRNHRKAVAGDDFSITNSKYVDINFTMSLTKNTLYMSAVLSYIVEYGDKLTGELRDFKINYRSYDIISLVAYLNALIFNKYRISDDIPDNMGAVNQILGFSLDKQTLDKVRAELAKIPIRYKKEISVKLLNNSEDISDLSTFFNTINDIMLFHESVTKLLDVIQDEKTVRILKNILEIISKTQYTKACFGDSKKYSEYLAKASPKIYDDYVNIIAYKDVDRINYEITQVITGFEKYVANNIADDKNPIIITEGLEPFIKYHKDKDSVKFLLDVLSYYKAYSMDLTGMPLHLEIGGDGSPVYALDDCKPSIEHILNRISAVYETISTSYSTLETELSNADAISFKAEVDALDEKSATFYIDLEKIRVKYLKPILEVVELSEDAPSIFETLYAYHNGRKEKINII